MLSDAEVFERAKKGFELSQRHTTSGGGAYGGNGTYAEGRELHPGWRKETKEAFDFVAGRMWAREDEENLNSQNRPIITFNRVEPMIRSICGVEINNRQEIHYDPNLPEDNDIAAVPNTAAKIIMSRGEFADEESEAFFDVLVCGMGFLDHYMDYDENPDGDLKESREDPLEFYWDPHARKQNLADGTWIGQMKRMSKAKGEELFPDADLSAKTFGQTSDEGTGHDDIARLNPPDIYKGIATSKDLAQLEDVSVYRYQYYAMETIIRLPGPEGTEPVNFKTDDDMARFKEIKRVMAEANTPLEKGVHYLEQKTKVYYHAFISGESVIKHERLPSQTGFTTKAITGLKDRNRNTWYGVLRSMRDPTRYANKFFSWQVFAFLTSNKGGFTMEESALAGQNEASFKADAAKPGHFLKVADGALTGGKIKFDEPMPYPQLTNEMNFAVGALPAVTGLSLEFLGSAERDQPGVLEQQRKMASMTILAPTFSALRRFRIASAKLLMEYMREYYSTPRLQRMVGKDLAPLVPQFKEKDELQYALLLDDAPESPSIKAAVYSLWIEWLRQDPATASKVADLFVQFSALPGPLADAISKRFQQMSQQTPDQQQAAGAQMAELVSKTVKNLASAELAKAQAQTVVQQPDLEHEQIMADALEHHTGQALDIHKHTVPSAEAKLAQLTPGPSA